MDGWVVNGGIPGSGSVVMMLLGVFSVMMRLVFGAKLVCCYVYLIL